MTLYADAMRQHLAAYKRDTLQIAEHGVWLNNGQEYDHILPQSLRRHNIIPSARDAFWDYFAANEQELPLHKDFHHLNSSQAFAFNLFFPFFGIGGDAQGLLAALGAPTEPLASWRFEHMLDQDERTSVDFFVEYASGRRLLVEVKLTETSFGTATMNETREQKRLEWYSPRLAGRVPESLLEPEAFYLKYQLLRNLAHLRLELGDRLILLMPRANETAWSEANAFVGELKDAARGAVSVVGVEDVLARLGQRGAGASGHVVHLKAKYAPDTRRGLFAASRRELRSRHPHARGAPMSEKLEVYRKLVAARKACARCVGLINPSTCADGIHDSDEIGPWTRWQGHLDAELMVVGQDWGDVHYFTIHAGLDESRNPTNRRLRTLLVEAGFDVADVGATEGRGTVFFTNAVLCLKTGGLSGPVNSEWFRECGPAFLRPQIEVVRPRVVVTLGERAYGALMRAFGLLPGRFREAVEAMEPTELIPGVAYFPVYHCSPRVLAGTRTLDRQREDWRRIGAWLGQEGTRPTPG